MVLGPLGDAAVRQVTAGVLQAEPSSDLLRMAERAGGNPFFLVEMLWGLQEEQFVRIEAGRAELVEARLPRRVGDNMRRRLDQMPKLAHQIAAVATALGRRFSLDDLAAMLDCPPSALLGPVEEVLHAGLFVESGEMLTFRHDLILEAVRASLPLPVSRALDRQAATVLIARGAMPLKVATRLAASAEPGDEIAIRTLSQAADALDASDPGAAADLSRRALDLAPRDHPLRRALVARTASLACRKARRGSKGIRRHRFAPGAADGGRSRLPPDHCCHVRDFATSRTPAARGLPFRRSPCISAPSCPPTCFTIW